MEKRKLIFFLSFFSFFLVYLLLFFIPFKIDGYAHVSSHEEITNYNFTNPSGGEILYLGSTYNITWTGGNSSEDITLILIDKEAWTVEMSVVQEIPNSGSYGWVAQVGGFGPGEKFLFIKGVSGLSWRYSAMFYIENETSGNEPIECTPSLDCGDWGSCINETQIRSCLEINFECIESNIEESQSCEVIYGCLDSEANNYNSNANVGDDSCEYFVEENNVIEQIEEIKELLPIKKPLTIPEDELVKCLGCTLSDKFSKSSLCYPLGYRKSGKYCSGEEFLYLLDSGQSCNHDFECGSNRCVLIAIAPTPSSKCADEGLLKKIFRLTKDFFRNYWIVLAGLFLVWFILRIYKKLPSNL